MLANQVPSISYSTGVLTADLLREHYAQLAGFLRQSVVLLSNRGYGIVDTEDPSAYTEGSQKPLWFVAQDKLNYLVYPGIAVTPGGDVVFQEQVQRIGLIDLSGALNLFVMQYKVQDSNERALTVTNQMIPVGRVIKTNLVCISEASYLAMDYESQSNCVVLGAVAYSSTQANTVYTAPAPTRPWLRKWFSFEDTKHRSYIGTGDVTEANIHGVGFSDMTMGGGLTIYDQLTSSGMILSKDTSISGVPGYFCSDAFTASQIKVDLTGAVTSGSFFGGTNSHYVELSAVPNVICGADDVDLNVPVAVDHIPGTKIVVVYNIQKPNNLVVSYTKSPSLMVADVNASSITVSGVSNKEVVISGGVPVRRLAQSVFPVRRYSSIPRNFRMFIDSDGFLLGDPNVIVPGVLAGDVLNTNLLVSAYIPKKPVFVGIGAHGLGNNVGFSMTVSIKGTSQGNDVTELLVFNNDTYQDTQLPPAIQENDKQVLFTKTSFSEVTGIEILSNNSAVFSGVQSNAIVIAYAKLDASKHRYAVVASGFWNGREAMRVRDSRRVLPVVRDGIYGTTAITSTAEILVGANEIVAGTATQAQKFKRITLVCAEDFREPRFLDAGSVLWEGREILDCPVIPKEIRDSSSYRSCYRSRVLPLRKYDSELCGFIVILNSVDSSAVEDGSVRVVLKNDGLDMAECVLKPMQDDLSGRIYIGYLPNNSLTTGNYRSAGFVISGRCAGFAAYFTNSSNIDPAYSVEVYPR